MSTVGDLFLKHQFHQFFGGRGHILEALSERNHREAHTLKVLHHLDSAPTVKGNLTDVVAFTQAFDEFFDVTIVNDIALGGLQEALPFPNIIRHMVAPDTQVEVIFGYPEIR